MKKLRVLILAAAILLTACGDKKTNTGATEESTSPSVGTSEVSGSIQAYSAAEKVSTPAASVYGNNTSSSYVNNFFNLQLVLPDGFEVVESGEGVFIARESKNGIKSGAVIEIIVSSLDYYSGTDEVSADYIVSSLEEDYKKELTSAKNAEISVEKGSINFIGNQTRSVNVHAAKDGVVTDSITAVLIKDGYFMLITAAAEASSSGAYLEHFTAIN